MKPVRLAPAALKELEETEAWFEDHAGLGSEFLREIRDAAVRIADSPLEFPVLPGDWPNGPVRKCVLRRFHYCLYFRESANELRILAIAHQRRRPGYWRRR